MKEQTKLWIDPPSGWQYGFPKIYEPAVDGDLDKWLVKEGYPEHMVRLSLGVRAWEVS